MQQYVGSLSSSSCGASEALFAQMMQLRTTPSQRWTPPPKFVAEFPVMVLFRMVPSQSYSPPPAPLAEFLNTVLFRMVPSQ